MSKADPTETAQYSMDPVGNVCIEIAQDGLTDAFPLVLHNQDWGSLYVSSPENMRVLLLNILELLDEAIGKRDGSDSARP